MNQYKKILVFATIGLFALLLGCADNDGDDNNVVFAVLNDTDNNVDILDTAGNVIVADIPVGDANNTVSSNGIASSGTFFAVVDSPNNAIDFFDADGNVILDNIATGTNPQGIAFGGGVFAVVNLGDDNVDFVDTDGNLVIQDIATGTLPIGIAFGDGVFAVANLGDGSFDLIDTNGTTIVDGTAIGGSPIAAAFGNGLFVFANQGQAGVNIVDSAGNIVVAQAATGNNTRSVAFGNGVFAAVNQGDNQMDIIDTNGNVIIADIATGNAPLGVAFSSGIFAVGGFLDNNVDFISANDGGIDVADIVVGGQPLCVGTNDVSAALRKVDKRAARSVARTSRFFGKIVPRGMELQWQNVYNDVIGFNVWRMAKGEKGFTKINGLQIMQGLQQQHKFLDIDALPEETSYYYKVEFIYRDDTTAFTHTTFYKSDVDKAKDKELIEKLAAIQPQ